MAQTWLLSELEMRSSWLFVISECCWCKININFKNWANLRAHIKQFLKIKTNKQTNDYYFLILVLLIQIVTIVSAKWQNSYPNWINTYDRLGGAEISTQPLKLLFMTHSYYIRLLLCLCYRFDSASGSFCPSSLTNVFQ